MENEHIVVSKEVKERLKAAKGEATWNSYLSSFLNAPKKKEDEILARIEAKQDEILRRLTK